MMSLFDILIETSTRGSVPIITGVLRPAAGDRNLRERQLNNHCAYLNASLNLCSEVLSFRAPQRSNEHVE